MRKRVFNKCYFIIKRRENTHTHKKEKGKESINQEVRYTTNNFNNPYITIHLDYSIQDISTQ